MSARKKFAFSMGAFLVLAVLSWNTMSATPVPVHNAELGIDMSLDFRLVTLAILGLLATRTALSFWRAMVEERNSEPKDDAAVEPGDSEG